MDDIPGASTRIEVWQWPADCLHGSVRVLSADEQRRASRFRRKIDRDRWIASRMRLRHLLADYLGIEPAEIQFAYGAHGKPAIANPVTDRLEFNLSHAGDLIVAAVSSVPVGIDIEPIRPLADMESVAEIVLSASERQGLHQLNESERPGPFFDYWTCKEAIVKARGQGVGEVSNLDLCHETVIVGDNGIRQAADHSWQVIPLELPAPFAGAVAVTANKEPIEVIYRKTS